MTSRSPARSTSTDAVFGRRTPVSSSPEPDSAGPSDRDALLRLIDEVEGAAYDVYRRNGLPDRAGEYVRAPRARKWTFIAPRLSAEDKWALLEQQPISAGWRYANLEALGLTSDRPEVRLASGVLGACRGLRRRADTLQPPTFQDLADALRLGDTYRQLANTAEAPQKARPVRRKRAKA